MDRDRLDSADALQWTWPINEQAIYTLQIEVPTGYIFHAVVRAVDLFNHRKESCFYIVALVIRDDDIIKRK